MSTEYVDHPLIRPQTVEKRSYQERIAGQCLKYNTLVCLPTGLGKSLVAVLVIAERLRQFPKGRAIVMAPTRPLVLQHHRTIQRTLALDENQIIAMTGENPPEERARLWDRRMVLSTPQILMNDLLSGRTDLNHVVVAVFDEAHRAVGDYPYTLIGSRCADSPDALILALTASPGSSKEAIDEVCRNLHIKHVESRTITSPDVKPYVGKLEVEWKKIELPEIFYNTRRGFQDYLKEKVRAVQRLGFLEQVTPDRIRLRDILHVREEIRRGDVDAPKEEIKRASSDLYACIHLTKMIELLETQGFSSLQTYLTNLQERTRAKPSSAIKRMLEDERVRRSVLLVNAACKEGIDHPKITQLISEIQSALARGARRLMAFTNYRSTAAKLLEVLNSQEGISAVRLVGQVTKGRDRGLSQKQQTAVLEDFRRGTYNVLIATQIGEEGLDIAECDEVVFYDNVPSAIRFIQRRGRTGRRGPGKATILMAAGTRDEAYYWVARKRERMMVQMLQEIEAASKRARAHPTLEQFSKSKASAQAKLRINIIVDAREGPSAVVRELAELGASIEMRSLLTADFIVSDRVAIERKSIDDFANSIIDGRLFSQARVLKNSYENPIMVIEGESWEPMRNVSPEALMGALASILVDYSLPVIWTRSPPETALLLTSLARREQIEEGRRPKVRAEPKPESATALQEYMVASLPNVDAVRSRRLLERFGTVERVFTAKQGELSEIEGIGKTISERIRQILTRRYRREET